jgi:hypothetical protein
MADNITVTVEQRLTAGRITELETILAEIRTMTVESKDCFPSHQPALRALFGGLIGMCWSHPEAIARYLWRQSETDRGALRG